ncbi:MAG: hypothetical protein E6R13_04860 [Spirochaetes bacterium]|nr:MAG: hypothetical protein E6R13_04860 [Spirochaetota bacterium]
MSFSQYSEYFDKHLTEIFSFVGGFISIHILQDSTFTMTHIQHIDTALPYLKMVFPYLGVVLKSILGGLVGYAVGKVLKKLEKNKKDEEVNK